MNAPQGLPGGSDFLSIRGTRLAWAELVDARLNDAAYREELRQGLQRAEPFPHLVVQDWFHPELLRLAREEFDLYPFFDGRAIDRRYENTVRSPRNPVLGPASATYFGIVNSGWFIALLAFLSGVSELLADPTLHNGGLHECRSGGRFRIHSDFELSECSGLHNEMVLITYLNEGWNPAWNGALELWDTTGSGCVRRVEPEFGRSILMRNGVNHYHGHPTPLDMPAQLVRRSLASYYYSNAGSTRRRRTDSRYLVVDPPDRLRHWARQVTPPLVWQQLRRLVR